MNNLFKWTNLLEQQSGQGGIAVFCADSLGLSESLMIWVSSQIPNQVFVDWLGKLQWTLEHTVESIELFHCEIPW